MHAAEYIWKAYYMFYASSLFEHIIVCTVKIETCWYETRSFQTTKN